MIAVSKRSMSLLPQKKAIRIDPEPFKQESKSLARIWCVKMEFDAHQPEELYSHLRVMMTYLKARYRLLDMLRAQGIERRTSSLKRWIANTPPDTGDLKKIATDS